MSCDPAERPVVRLDKVAKSYRLYDRPSGPLLERLLGGPPRHRVFPALADIDLSVSRGETVGIVGANGCGKSTLLKIIAGLLAPTAGEVRVTGRVSAILELGAGFNPEFTGRANVLVNGAIMGFSQKEMNRRLERVAAFAEIGEHLDQPVRTLSSGMYARLAFACAAHLDPDILLVDEALAVGDMFFQARCMDHMRRMIDDRGVTLFFVSHDIVAVSQLCQRAIYLKDGRIEAQGPATEVTERYRRDIQMRLSRLVTGSGPADGANGPAPAPGPAGEAAAMPSEPLAAPSPAGAAFRADPAWEAAAAPERYGLGRARFRCVETLDASGRPQTVFRFRQPVTVRGHVECLDDLDAPHCAIIVRNKEGLHISQAYTLDTTPYRFPPLKRGDRLIVQFTFANIFHGDASYLVYLAINNSRGLDRQTVEDQVPLACLFASERDPDHPVHYLVWQDFAVAHRHLPAGRENGG